MKVLIVSKALIMAEYRRKLDAMVALGLDVVAAVPPQWRDAGRHVLEPEGRSGYRLVVTPIRFNGHFHVHYYPRLPELIACERPDVVHLDEEPYNTATFLGARAARSYGAAVVFFTWQNIIRRYPPPFAWMERVVYRASSLALAGSRDAARVLQIKGFAGPVAVVPQFGVDPDVFSPGDRPSGEFTIGFPNRLVAGKGPMILLDAVACLPKNVRVRFVGDGPLAGRLSKEIARRGLTDRATIEQRLPSGRMPDFLRSCHAIVLPSVTTRRWKEQFGRVLIEAMSCGVPVVGSSSGEIPHVIGDAGLIVPEGDPEALAGALGRLQVDDDLWTELRRRGRERVLQMYTQEGVARATFEAYRKALDSPASSVLVAP